MTIHPGFGRHLMYGSFRRDMRVAMDARMLGAGGTGVSTYARSLMAALPHLSTAPLLVGATPAMDGGKAARMLRALPYSARALGPLGEQDGMPLAAGHDIFRTAQMHFDFYNRVLPVRVPGPVGIMHWSSPVPLRLEGWHNFYTVHDAIPLERPDLTPIRPDRHARLLAAILPGAAGIVSVSEDARAAIIRATGRDPRHIVDCGQPVLLPRRVPPPLADYPPGGYFLFCGTVEPRKNLVRLVAAWRRSGTRLPLLLVGPDGWQADREMAAIGTESGVIRLPYQDRDTLVGLIAHARALLFPSLAEGFGLPVAEAMALGTPVLTSAGGALGETAGDAALTIDPLDVPAMAAAIHRLAGDDLLAARLSAMGRARAGSFTLDRFVGCLSALHDRFIAQPAGAPERCRARAGET